MSTHYSLRVIRVQDVQWRPRILRKIPDLYVEVKLGRIIKRTRTVKKNLSPTWDETLTLPLSDESIKLSIQVKHASVLPSDPCVGFAAIKLADLVAKCDNGEAAQISLHRPSSKALAGMVHLRLEVADRMTTIGLDLKGAARDVQRARTGTSGSNSVAFAEGAMQLNDGGVLYDSLSNLCKTMSVFIGLIDDVSKIHPYLNAAWQVTSALYKVISKQFESDEKVVYLVRSMEKAFDFAHDTQTSLRDKTRILESSIIDLLQQIKECCEFIQEYMAHSFAGRILELSASQKIDEFLESLADCKDAIDTGLVLHNAIITGRTSEKVDTVYLHQRLKPDEPLPRTRDTCLQGTRVGIRRQVIDWVNSESGPNILWLYGVAGSGKSTISVTISDYFHDIHQRGAFLFFERGKSDPSSVIRTIAFKLASFDRSIRSLLIDEIEKDEDIAFASPARQFDKLILLPLENAAVKGPIVIILDALDECGSPETRRELMQLLQHKFSHLSKKFRFLITSRPESDICTAFLSSQGSVRAIELDYTSVASQDDVLSFIRMEMQRAVRDQVEVPNDWPWDANMLLLGKGSGGLFIWASTAVKLVSSSYNPFRKLEELVSDSRSLNRYGLDKLYATVLQSSGIAWDDDECRAHFSKILALILFSKIPLSISTIDGILGFPPHDSSRFILSRFQCLLAYTPNTPVRLFHTSLVDYLVSSDRFSDPWFIDIPAQQTFITTRSFNVMKDILCFNICNLESSYVANDRVPGLQDRIEKNIPSHLAYVCLSWARHLREAPYSSILLDTLSDFLHNHLLYWLEVLSLLGKANNASPALFDAVTWVETSDAATSAFLKDAQGLVTRFAPCISQSSPHIYLSAIPLSSKESKILAHYLRRLSSIVQVDQRGAKSQSLLQKIYYQKGMTGVAFSRDGRRIAVGFEDGMIKLLDAENGETVTGPFLGHTDTVWCLAFSYDGTRIASGSEDHIVKIWDAESGKLVSGPFIGHAEAILAVAFSPDGTCVVSGSWDGTISIWNAKSGEAVSGPFEGHVDSVYSVTFSPDGTRIVSGSDDATIGVWDAKSGEVASGPFKGHTSGVRCVAFSPDGTQIVSGSNDMSIRVWDAESGETVSGPFAGHTDDVRSVSFSSDGTRIVSGSDDKTIRVWDVESGEVVLGPFEGHTNNIYSVVFLPDSTYILSGSEDETIIVWDTKNGETAIQAHTSGVVSVALSPDGSCVALSFRDWSIRIWDMENGEVLSGPFVGHTGIVLCIAFSHDGSLIVSGSEDKTIMVWDVNSGQTVSGPFIGHTGSILSVAFSLDGARIVSGSGDKTIRVWDAESGEVISGPFEKHRARVMSVAFSPDGTRVVSGSQDKTIKVWDASSGDVVSGAFKGHVGGVWSVAFSSDGTRIVSGSEDETVRVWDAESGWFISGPFKGHTSLVTSVAFSPDGTHIVSGSWDNKIRAWDVESGELIPGSFEGHIGNILSVAFLPDGTSIVSGSSDNTIRIWDTTRREVVSGSFERHTFASISESSAPLHDDKVFLNWLLHEDGWIRGEQGELLLWVPPDLRGTLWRPQNTAILTRGFSTKLDFTNSAHGEHWVDCFKPPR